MSGLQKAIKYKAQTHMSTYLLVSGNVYFSLTLPDSLNYMPQLPKKIPFPQGLCEADDQGLLLVAQGSQDPLEVAFMTANGSEAFRIVFDLQQQVIQRLLV